MYKDFLPKKEHITKKHTTWLGKRLYDKNLWSFNGISVPRGVAIGFFVAFIPLPIQMILSITLATLCRGNIPLAIACTWVTNPVTFIPINYFIHDFGEWILNMQHQEIFMEGLDFNNSFNKNFDVISDWAHALGKPFFVALPVVALGASITAYILAKVVWFIISKARNINVK